MKTEIFKIMIGAASDADEYVDAAKEQMAQWNAINSDYKYLLLVEKI